MNLAAHNLEFSDGCSNTELLSRNATLSSQLGSAHEQIADLIRKNSKLIKENTALSQRIEELERSATLDSTNSCKPPSSDGLRKPNGEKDKNKKKEKRQGQEKADK